MTAPAGMPVTAENTNLTNAEPDDSARPQYGGEMTTENTTSASRITSELPYSLSDDGDLAARLRWRHDASFDSRSEMRATVIVIPKFVVSPVNAGSCVSAATTRL
jgi:hypothetical protein